MQELYQRLDFIVLQHIGKRRHATSALQYLLLNPIPLPALADSGKVRSLLGSLRGCAMAMLTARGLEEARACFDLVLARSGVGRGRRSMQKQNKRGGDCKAHGKQRVPVLLQLDRSRFCSRLLC